MCSKIVNKACYKKRLVTRNKILIVPYYVTHNNNHKLILVEDVKTREWGFISGGIKRNETPMDAAKRECNEETSSTLNFPKIYETFKFISLYRPVGFKLIDDKRNEIVRSIYTVFKFEIQNIDLDRMKAFTPNKEVLNIKSDYYECFKKTWCFSDDVYNTYIRKNMIRRQ